MHSTLRGSRAPAVVAALALLAGCAPQRDATQRDAAPTDTVVAQLILPDSVRRAREESLAVRRRDSIATARADSILRATPGYVVDSALAPEVALARFRDGVTRVEALGTGAAPTRDSLVARLLAAAARGDRRELEAMAVSRAEYAWLIFPRLPISRAPYRQPPDVAWFLLTQDSRTGLSRLLSHFATGGVGWKGYACDEPPQMLEGMRSWPTCRVNELQDGRAPRPIRLFGTIVELDGRFKLLSFANDF